MPLSSTGTTSVERGVQRLWIEAITGFNDGALAGLLSCCPDLILGGVGDVADLARAVISPGSVKVRYDSADRTSRVALEALCVLPEATDTDALAAALGTQPEALEPVLGLLETAALVLRDGDRLVRNPGLAAAIPHPAGLGIGARSPLEAQSVATLTDLAGRLGVVAKGPKAAIVTTLVGVLSSPERMAAVVAAGPAGTKAMAERLAHENLQISFGYGNYYREAQSDRTPVGWLLRRGLVVTESWGLATMPAEVAVALRGGRLFDSFTPEPPPVATTVGDGEQVDQRAAQIAIDVVADVADLLGGWGADPPKLLQAGGLGVREVRRVAKATKRTEVDAARIIELAVFAGLADHDGAVALPTPSYDRWLGTTTAERWVWLVDAWLHAAAHLSLAGATDTRNKMIPPLLDRPPESEAIARRKLVLSLLRPGRSADAASVIDRAQWQMPTLWEGGPARPERLATWILEEAELLGISVGQFPSSFGLALVEEDPDDAAAALAQRSPPLTTELVLQADLTAMASGELAPDLRRQLDVLADVESTGAATVYRFSESSLRRGFDAGQTSAEMLTLLGEHARKGVPQPLTYLIEDLGRRHGQVRVGSASSYVRCSDASLLAEVVHAKKTARLHLQLLAPTVAVGDAEPAAVVATLREAGYLAAPEHADGTLVLSAPPARRAPGAPDDDADDEFALLGDLLDDPALLAALSGLPTAVLESATTDQLRRFLTDDGTDGEEETGPDVVAAMVQRLRNAPPPAPSPPPSPPPRRGTPPPGPRPRPAVVQARLLDDDDPPRPGHIAQDGDAIIALVDEAIDEGWLVRLSYVNGKGEEAESWVEPLALSRRTLRVNRVGRGGGQELVLRRIRWARIATAAEEESQW